MTEVHQKIVQLVCVCSSTGSCKKNGTMVYAYGRGPTMRERTYCTVEMRSQSRMRIGLSCSRMLNSVILLFHDIDWCSVTWQTSSLFAVYALCKTCIISNNYYECEILLVYNTSTVSGFIIVLFSRLPATFLRAFPPNQCEQGIFQLGKREKCL